MTRTGKLVYDETPEDWSTSFRGAWAANGGHAQSLAFALGGLRRIFTMPDFAPFTTLRYIHPDEYAFNHFKVHDYGCATGDGTALLQAAFVGANVTGFDTSEVAIDTARARWPGMQFEVGDVRAPREDANIIWTSHTVEHTRDAAFCVNGLLTRCQALVVIVPWISALYHAGHEGAEHTSEWLKRCPPPTHSETFNIMRYNPEANVWIAEGSWMYVWQGELKA